MAIVQRASTLEEGAIPDPRDVTDNIYGLINEFNGGLDADNLPDQSVTAEMCLLGAFTSIVWSGTDTPIAFKGETIEWRRTNDLGAYLGQLTITNLNTDAMLEVEWSGTWQRGLPADNLLVGIKLLVDGAEVARMPLSSGRRKSDSVYLIGSVPVTAGRHTITVEVKQWISNTDSNSTETITFGARELIVTAYKR